jgi:hypothetical protein
MEVIVPFAKRLEKGVQIPYVDGGGLREPLTPGNKLFIANGESFIRTEGWKHLRRQIRLGDCFMVAEVVSWVVSCTDGLDTELLENRMRRQPLRQHSIGPLPDCRR